ncbi:MAG: MipA/OmpV family protein [Rhodocyclaceae bacterium]
MNSPKKIRRLILSIALAAPMLAQAQAPAPAATDDWNVILGIGAIWRPKYPGADSNEVDPAPFILATHGRWLLGAAPGTGLPFGVAYHLVQTPAFKMGIGVGDTFVKAREESDDPGLAGLGDIDGTAKAAAFASYTYKWLTLRGAVTTDVGGNDQGTQAFVDLDGRFQVTSRLSISGGPGLTWSDGKYSQTFFGIDGDQSRRSGRAEYKAGSGLSAVRLTLGADYALTTNWNLGTRIVFTKLQGDAADSPITRDDVQSSGTVFVTYRF